MPLIPCSVFIAVLWTACSALANDITVIGQNPLAPTLDAQRALSTVDQATIQKQISASAPEALRYQSAVFVQQTAAAQSSVFLRGLTGQQTLLLFDGIRINTSIFRQGPNQYFTTVDPRAIASISVQRGGASTPWGSDALGGALLALPILPSIVQRDAHQTFAFQPRLHLDHHTADASVGGRGQLDALLGPKVAVVAGIGGRGVGLLAGGGILPGIEPGSVAQVPRMDPDGRIQLGTGYKELTQDTRVVFALDPNTQLTLAGYLYRQYDAPRTDQCPAAFAPFDECLVYDEQFRSLVYAALQGRPKMRFLSTYRWTLSWQQQHERRSRDRPSSRSINLGRDTLDSLGLTFRGHTARWQQAKGYALNAQFGMDAYVDFLKSRSWIQFTDIDQTLPEDRGQYIEGSRYAHGGIYAQLQQTLTSAWSVSAGARLGWAAAHAPALESQSAQQLNRIWIPASGYAGLSFRPTPKLRLQLNFDRSFRAPNLNDLTARQPTGPGLQFENPDLDPETSQTLELGIVARPQGWDLSLWGFYTQIQDPILKSPGQSDAQCPQQDAECLATSSERRLQLVNGILPATLWGVEARAAATLPWHLRITAHAAWAIGTGPAENPGEDATAQEPLSRIPPLSGVVLLDWDHPLGLYLGAALRWATPQTRLRGVDVLDPRIPSGGTPGFAVADLRLGYTIRDRVAVHLVFENIADSVYRYHGSSINGAGRSVRVGVDLGPLWRMGS